MLIVFCPLVCVCRWMQLWCTESYRFIYLFFLFSLSLPLTRLLILLKRVSVPSMAHLILLINVDRSLCTASAVWQTVQSIYSPTSLKTEEDHRSSSLVFTFQCLHGATCTPLSRSFVRLPALVGNHSIVPAVLGLFAVSEWYIAANSTSSFCQRGPS